MVSGVRLKMEVVTPLYMRGQDSSENPLDAFRVPSLRGLARFWFRALMGGVIGNTSQNLDCIERLEGQVFGSTEQASLVQFRLEGIPRSRRGVIDRKSSGMSDMNYLAFSLWDRPAVPPGESIVLVINVRPGVQGDISQNGLGIVLGSLWLLTHLGGLGARSRRGFGSIAVVNPVSYPPELEKLPPFICEDSEPERYASFLSSGIGRLANLYQEYARRMLRQKDWGESWSQSARLPKYDILARRVARVRVSSDHFQSWEQALSSLGGRLKRARTGLSPTKRQIFGLPLPRVSSQRRSSPLLFKIVRFRSGEYGAVLTLFKAQFSQGSGTTDANYGDLDEFLNGIQGHEVQLP